MPCKMKEHSCRCSINVSFLESISDIILLSFAQQLKHACIHVGGVLIEFCCHAGRLACVAILIHMLPCSYIGSGSITPKNSPIQGIFDSCVLCHFSPLHLQATHSAMPYVGHSRHGGTHNSSVSRRASSRKSPRAPCSSCPRVCYPRSKSQAISRTGGTFLSRLCGCMMFRPSSSKVNPVQQDT